MAINRLGRRRTAMPWSRANNRGPRFRANTRTLSLGNNCRVAICLFKSGFKIGGHFLLGSEMFGNVVASGSGLGPGACSERLRARRRAVLMSLAWVLLSPSANRMISSCPRFLKYTREPGPWLIFATPTHLRRLVQHHRHCQRPVVRSEPGREPGPEGHASYQALSEDARFSSLDYWTTCSRVATCCQVGPRAPGLCLKPQGVGSALGPLVCQSRRYFCGSVLPANCSA